MIRTTSRRLELEDFVNHFSTRIERAADEIAENTTPSVQRNSVLWKMRVIPTARRTLRRADEAAVMMDLWLLCSRSTAWFTKNEKGMVIFGDSTPIAQEAAKDLETSIRSLARSILDEEKFEAAAQSIAEYTTNNRFDAHLPVTVADKGQWNETIGGVLGKPMNAVTRPLNYIDPTSGLDQAAKAAAHVAATVDRTRVDLNYMPDNLRWQTELMLMELQENTALSSVVDSLQQVSEASNSLAQTSSTLPKDLRIELTTFMEDFGEEQAGLQATLKDLDTTLASIDGTLEDVDKIVLATDETAKSLTTMAEAYSTLVDDVSKLMLQVDPPPDPSDPPAPAAAKGPPFDISEYGSTAGKLTETANGLTALVTELQVLTESKQSTVLLDNTEELLSSVMNQILFKGVSFVLLVGLIALGYRVAVRKLT